MSISTDTARDDLDTIIAATRVQFIDSFERRFESLRTAIQRLASGEGESVREPTRQILHRMAGIAGMIGLPAVGERAADLEALLMRPAGGAAEGEALLAGVAALDDAFRAGVAQLRPAPVPAPTALAAAGSTILLVEDDPEQRAVAAGVLDGVGYRVVGADSGERAIAILRGGDVHLVLMDVNLPGQDGFITCREIKTDPALHDIPVIFVTTRASLADRVAALSLGADDYLIKPVDPTELRLRVEIVLRRLTAARSAQPAARVASYEAFAREAASVLAARPAAAAFIRPMRGFAEPTAEALIAEMRNRDRLGRYDNAHLVMLLPDISAAEASGRLSEVAARVAAEGYPLFAGVAATASANARDLASLLNEADEALAQARYLGEAVAVHGARRRDASRPAAALGIVVIAEDDPSVARVVETQVRGAGYETVLAFDGREALRQVQQIAPVGVVLDLMLPHMTGFDVLSEIQRLPPPQPRVVVVSARGRDTDVTRAFDLGADDYLTKPFSPQELLARLARLLR